MIKAIRSSADGTRQSAAGPLAPDSRPAPPQVRNPIARGGAGPQVSAPQVRVFPRKPCRRHARSALVCALCLAGCAAGPDFKPPAAPALSAYTRENVNGIAADGAPKEPGDRQGPPAAQTFDTGLDIGPRWWTAFGSPELDQMVDAALAANPTIESARAALRIAEENVAAQRGFYLPAVQAQYSPSRQRNAIGTLAPTLASSIPVYSLSTAQLTISYVPDAFGLNRRQVETLKAQEAATRAQFNAARVSLANNVVVAVVQRALLAAQLDATQRIIVSQRLALGNLEKQFEAGYAGRQDLAAQQAALAQAEATLPPLRRQLEQTRDLLAALVRNDPSKALPEVALDALNLPRHLPLSLPGKIVAQRPDVQAALEQLHAATAQLGVADASLLPQFAISAQYGGVATSPADLFRPDNVFWSLVASATQTVFDGGTLRARRRAAEAGIDQALAVYELTLVQACQNVADTLYALQTDASAMDATVRGEEAARASLTVSEDQVRLGYASALSLLAAQQVYQQAVLSRLQARGAWLADTAALFQALGGGWWNAENAEPVDAASRGSAPGSSGISAR